MVGGPTHRDPAAAGLELVHHGQQLVTGFGLKNRTRHIDHVGLKDFDQSEVLQSKFHLRLQIQAMANFVGEADVGRQQVNPDGPRLKYAGGCEDGFAPATAQVQKALTGLEAGILQDAQGCKVGGFSEAKVAKGAFAQGAPLQPDI